MNTKHNQKPEGQTRARKTASADTKSSKLKTATVDRPRLQEKISIKPSTLLAPVPVILVSCKGKPGSDKDKANLITVAWTGTVCSDPPMIAISIRKSRWSYSVIKETREFVVNLVNKDLLASADYCGVKSGADVDKFQDCRLQAIPAEGLHYAPAVSESPLTLSCRLSQIIELGSHDLFIAKIVAVEVASVLMKGSKIALDRAGLVAYAHGEYYALDKMLGFFGFSVASAAVLKRRMPDGTIPRRSAGDPPLHSRSRSDQNAGRKKAADKRGKKPF